MNSIQAWAPGKFIAFDVAQDCNTEDRRTMARIAQIEADIAITKMMIMARFLDARQLSITVNARRRADGVRVSRRNFK